MIALFIGSFNPPTLAHLEIVKKVRNDFTKVVFVPVNSTEKELISIRKRIDMLNIYCHQYAFLEVNDVMKDYAYFNFRILDLLKEQYGDVMVIMGDDLLKKMINFDAKDYLLKNYHFLIVTRFFDDLEKFIKENYFAYQDKFKLMYYHNPCSSTMVRSLLKNRKYPKEFLDKEIIRYIKKEELYV